ncbi:hypothetical protein [Streptomyces sp. TP-A0874]|uniref:hypothetical protein n=1 Tax=Streptomyces sp. TP-A0874 TaxID=549819 RepID=UPI000852FDD4|nr:hypothetical protein [Streptomyces sp. TP-A0874]
MPPESALLESRALRDSVADRTEVLDKVKALTTLPDGLHLTTRLVAGYFEVPENTMRQLVARHRQELSTNGLTTLRGPDLERFKRDTLSRYSGWGYPQPKSNLTLFTRRAVLNAAMLLRDSGVARRVRTHLLDSAERVRAQDLAGHAPSTGCVSLEELVTDTAAKAAERVLAGAVGARLTAVESGLEGVGSALRELGSVIARASARMDRMDRRLESIDHRLSFVDRQLGNTSQVVCAMSERMARMDTELRELRADTARLRPRRPQRGGGRR